LLHALARLSVQFLVQRRTLLKFDFVLTHH
jgi:hypothetical protein